MTSIKRAGRIATFGFAVGAGFLIASGAAAAVATAAPDDSSHASSSASSASGSSSSSARSARPSTGTAGKPKPSSKISARSDASAPVVQLHSKRSPAAVAVATADEVSAVVPTSSAKTVTPKRVPALPTPADVQQAISAGLGTVRRNLDDLREKIETLVENQVIGFQNSLLDLRIDLQRILSNKPLVYGDPTNSRFWVAQGDETAYLMAAAMAINRFTGQTVTAASMVDEAMTTASTVRPDRNMYLGPTTSDYVWPADAYQLMENHGVKVTTTSYNLNQGRQAFNALEAALAGGKSVIVTITGPTTSVANPAGEQDIDQHPVVLLAIDITNDVVYLNDGALPVGGQRLTMSLDKFIDTWRTSFYSTTTAELAPVIAQTVSPAAEAIAA